MSRKLGWNGLYITIPKGCDDIVSGKRHLVLEKDFRPILELRWEDGHTKTRPATVDSVARKMLKAQPESLRPAAAPAALQPFIDRHNGRFLAYKEPEQGCNLIWQCCSCRTLITAQLYHHPDISDSTLSGMLESLQCHHPENAPLFWSVQDFSLVVPHSFKLEGFRFEAGLTRLLFQNANTRLMAFRIAPAADKLAENDLDGLLCSLHEQFTPELIVPTGEDQASCATEPSIARQIRLRLKRKKPFCRGIIRHMRQPNRLIAMVQESKQPIDAASFEELFSQYEIIS